MKKLFFLIPFISLSCFAQSKLDVGPKDIQIRWKGSNVVGGGHEGKLSLLSGSIQVAADRKVTGGTFVMDMNSIKAIDEHGDGVPELQNHLKSEDFFAVNRFPMAFFLIARVDRATNFVPDQFTVSGLLTIKGITNGVSFPATITVVDGTTRIKATMTFNRTKWDIIYQSANFLAN